MVNKNILINLAKYGTGVSSEGIIKKHLGIDDGYPTPVDSDDLMRCITIVELSEVPISIMKDVSPAWKGIVEQWDILKELSLDEKNNKIIHSILKVINNGNIS